VDRVGFASRRRPARTTWTCRRGRSLRRFVALRFSRRRPPVVFARSLRRSPASFLKEKQRHGRQESTSFRRCIVLDRFASSRRRITFGCSSRHRLCERSEAIHNELFVRNNGRGPASFLKEKQRHGRQESVFFII